MAAEVQNGVGILYGVTNSGSSITMTGYASFILDTTKAQHKFGLDSVDDENKADAALIATNAHIELDINWTPKGATRTAAAATAAFLTPLSQVVLANFKAATFNGTYIYIGDGSIDLSHGPAKMSLKLRRYVDSAQNTSLSTTVSG